jgi:hypothetical protein
MMEFRRLLEECLERIRQGDSVQSCLKTHAEHAAELQPYLATAAALRGLRVRASGKAAARQQLMRGVAMGTGKEEAVFGVMKFAHVIGAVVGALFLMSVGLVAASGGGGLGSPFGGGDHKETRPSALEVKGRVAEVGDEVLVIEKGDLRKEFAITDDTVFKDGRGNAIDGVERGDLVTILAEKRDDRWVALKVRLVTEDQVAKPKATPTPEATPAPEATPVPDAVPGPETPGGSGNAPPPAGPQPSGAVFEGWVKEVGEGSFLLKKGDGTKISIGFNGSTVFDGNLAPGATVRVEALVYPEGHVVATRVTVTAAEFWGIVVSVGSGNLVVNTEFGQATVHFGPSTQWSGGDPFPGVKVIINAVKNADGTFTASHITVKTAEFSGPVAWLNAAAMGVNAWDTTLTVKWDGNTAWEGPDPHVGSQVMVLAYKLGDGTFLARKIVVKADSFQGTVISHTPGEFTIQVQVEAQVRTVCYEFADVIGTLAVGKLVLVQVDHVEGSTHFASLVKVLN